MNRRTSFVIVHEARIDTGNRNVVSKSIQMLTPSTPTV